MAPGPHHPASGSKVYITGASFLWVDTFDETKDGKSKGTVYLQDVGSQAPYAGTSLYSPTYLPANLSPTPGDVLDLTGTFTVNTSIGAAHFTPPTALIQIDKPVVTGRFEYTPPVPVVIQASDLDDYNKGLQWEGMLVTVQNITLIDPLVDDGKGRDTLHIFSGDATSNGPTLANELFDIATWNKQQTPPPLQTGTTLCSVTGVVTWFFNFHLCPRSPDDIKVVCTDAGQ